MRKSPARYRQYGRNMAHALNEGREIDYLKYKTWYQSTLKHESLEDQPRAELEQRSAFLKVRITP